MGVLLAGISYVLCRFAPYGSGGLSALHCASHVPADAPSAEQMSPCTASAQDPAHEAYVFRHVFPLMEALLDRYSPAPAPDRLPDFVAAVVECCAVLGPRLPKPHVQAAQGLTGVLVRLPEHFGMGADLQGLAVDLQGLRRRLRATAQRPGSRPEAVKFHETFREFYEGFARLLQVLCGGPGPRPVHRRIWGCAIEAARAPGRGAERAKKSMWTHVEARSPTESFLQFHECCVPNCVHRT